MAVMARAEVTLTRIEVDEETHWHFWHDEEGAHVTEGERPADGGAIVGKNVLLTGDGLQVRDGSTVLARFADGVVDLAPSDTYGGNAEVRLPGNARMVGAVGDGENSASLERVLDSSDNGGNVRILLSQNNGGDDLNQLAQVSLVNRPSGANGGAVLLGGSLIGISVYGSDEPPTYWSFSQLADVLNNAPYVTSEALLVAVEETTAPDGSAYASIRLSISSSTAYCPVTLGSDGTSFSVRRSGIYLACVKGVVRSVVAGDLCHVSLLEDGDTAPRVNVQDNVNGEWAMLSGSEAMRMEVGRTFRLGYACEQGGGSLCSAATLTLVYLGA